MSGLGESMRTEWSGDVDLNDGSLKEQYQGYIQRLDFIKNLGLEDRKYYVVQDLNRIYEELASDLNFINEGGLTYYRF